MKYNNKQNSIAVGLRLLMKLQVINYSKLGRRRHCMNSKERGRAERNVHSVRACVRACVCTVYVCLCVRVRVCACAFGVCMRACLQCTQTRAFIHECVHDQCVHNARRRPSHSPSPSSSFTPGVPHRLRPGEEVPRHAHARPHHVQGGQEPDGHGALRQHQRAPRRRAESTGRPRVPRLRHHVLRPRLPAVAGAEGGDQEAEVREDKREEDGDGRGGPLQGLPAGVRALPQLLSRTPLRRGARLRVLAQGALPAALQQEDALPVRLPVRLVATAALESGQRRLGRAPGHDAYEAVIGVSPLAPVAVKRFRF